MTYTVGNRIHAHEDSGGSFIACPTWRFDLEAVQVVHGVFKVFGVRILNAEP